MIIRYMHYCYGAVRFIINSNVSERKSEERKVLEKLALVGYELGTYGTTSHRPLLNQRTKIIYSGSTFTRPFSNF